MDVLSTQIVSLIDEVVPAKKITGNVGRYCTVKIRGMQRLETSVGTRRLMPFYSFIPSPNETPLLHRCSLMDETQAAFISSMNCVA